MKKRRILFLSAVIAFMLIFNQTALAAGKKTQPPTTPIPATTTTVKPIFSSSFIQYWFCEDWDIARWKAEFTMMQNIGINEVIIQTVGNTKTKYTAYFTKLPGYTHNEVDMLRNALTAADDTLGMKVRIGLVDSADWWTKKASDRTWLNNEATQNKAVFNEILNNYGHHTSLGGWYIPYEFSNLTATSSTTRANLNTFLKNMGTEISLKDTKRDIMIAPYFDSRFAFMGPLSSWATNLQTILKDTKINIVALQDSVGVKYNTLSQVPNIFANTKKATDALGMTLYADTETFTYTSSGNVPAPQSRIEQQLSIEKAYVKGFVAFSISHFQNYNVENQMAGYYAYKTYYLRNI